MLSFARPITTGIRNQMRRKPKRIVILIAALILIFILLLARDLYLKTQKEIICDDGIRRTIDIRDFTTTYWAYSIELEATVKDKTRLSGRLKPQQLQSLSESLQQANEIRKFIVAGFNACAITKVQYLHYGAQFQTLDNLGRQIDNLIKSKTISDADRNTLTNLVQQYIQLTKELGKEGK